MAHTFGNKKNSATVIRTVTKMRHEERTRVVVTKDGKQIEQEYTVAIPYTETVEVAGPSVATGFKPRAFSVKAFRFYGVRGNELTHDEAAKQLSAFTSVFLLDNHPGTFNGFPEPQLSVLNPETIVAVTRSTVHPSSEQRKTPRRPDTKSAATP